MFKRFKRSVFVLPVFLAACATTQNYSLTVHSWEGASADRLVSIWGHPNRVEHLSNGNTLYIYKEKHVEQTPVTTIPGRTVIEKRHHETIITRTPPETVGGEIREYRCTTNFEVNRNGRVVSVDFRGNDCVATKSFVMEQANPAKIPQV